ncbi:MAG: TlpA family protein disulfide reductase [Leadbetterella sp.]|nr:TlpA family protein disulfide reductase [Leadbetterella sp.]
MRTTLLLLCLATFTFKSQAQNSAAQVLENFNAAVQKIKHIEYTGILEINNPGDDYFHKDTTLLYVEFDKSYPADLYRYIRTAKTYKRIYTTQEDIILNTSDKDYEAKRSDLSDAGIYHSILTLRVALPQLLNTEQLEKTVSDTVINNRVFVLLKVKLPEGKIIDFPTGINQLSLKTIVSLHTFVLDPDTWLPWLLIYENSHNKGYSVKNYFLDINLNPSAPSPTTWTLAGYPDFKKKSDPELNPFIKVGEAFPDWELPVFQPGKTPQTLSSSHTKGKFTLIEFWVKNCGPCQEAFKDMKQLSQKYQSINILSINMEDKDTEKDLDFIYRREQPLYPILYRGSGLAKAIGVNSYPRGILLDETGKVIFTIIGFNFEKVDTFLKTYLP